MLLWQTGLSYASRRMPKVIGPATHAVLDYAVAGAFLFMAARFWKRNRRAAMGSLLCGGVAVAGNLLTDYPGGALELLDYGTHRNMDAGLAALTAATPRLMGFSGDPEAGFFGAQALVETAINSMTDFEYYE